MPLGEQEVIRARCCADSSSNWICIVACLESKLDAGMTMTEITHCAYLMPLRIHIETGQDVQGDGPEARER